MRGPFDVDPEAVRLLGAAFAPFVNDLLEAERVATRIAGPALEINWQHNTADGGVDAVLQGVASASTWLPLGDSVWQFKSSDLAPADCRKELRGAEWAQERMRDGATYVLVLGQPLTDQKTTRRRTALVEEATTLELLVNDRQIRIYDGNQLARWISSIPSLALDIRLGAPGAALLDYSRWVASRHHQDRWVECVSRDDVQEMVRRVGRGELDLCRIEGGSGLGKTRLVMETLGEDEIRRLVACAPRADGVSTEILTFLQTNERNTILVVDECSQGQHKSIAEQLAVNSGVQLISIGPEGGDVILRDPISLLAPATESEISGIVRANLTSLWDEASRIIASSCFGNVRMALLLGERLVETGETAVAALLRDKGINGVVLHLLPEQIDFFAAAVLALLERVGWDRDRRHQLQALSEFSGIPTDELETAGRILEDAGLFTRLGRYRSMTPQPLAVLLAAECWERLGERIVTDLLPRSDREMTISLFRRCAELGRFEPAQAVLRGLLGSAGPFGTLERLEQDDVAELLIQLAIIAPYETADYLCELIEGATLEELARHTRSRRSLVWALEKLAWHRDIFDRAADALLRLALAENETWANNATGQWVALFAARLPATSAMPAERINYLANQLRSQDDAVRLLAVTAAGSALHPFESAMVSGELQGGEIVAPRGSVVTGEEARAYWSALIDLLKEAIRDNSDEVREAAEEALISAVHPFIDAPEVGSHLADAFQGFRDEALRRLRRSVTRLLEMADMGSRSPLREALRHLLAQLPEPPLLDRVRELVDLPSWDWHERPDRESELIDLLGETKEAGLLDDVLAWLSESELKSAGQLGAALASVDAGPRLEGILTTAASLNPAALAGYLDQKAKRDQAAFDRFLDSPSGRALPSPTRLYLSTVGPLSPAAQDRTLGLLDGVSVADGANQLFRWQENLTPAQLDSIASRWQPRIASQVEYDAVIEFFGLLLHRHSALDALLWPRVVELLQLRTRYPNLAHARWNWCRLAGSLVSQHARPIAETIFELVSSHNLIVLEDQYEAEVIRLCNESSPQDVWNLVGTRLEDHDWRLAMVLRGWFTQTVPLDAVTQWVGGSRDRARLVAGIATSGDERPSELAVHLLTTFDDDADIADALAAEFVSGSWWGPWSEHLQGQVDTLNRWNRDASLPLALRRWARRLSEGLAAQRVAALQREAEEQR